MRHSEFFEEARTARKWFMMDKNYILKEAQLVLKEQLVFWTEQYGREFYKQYHNPLGLIDDTVELVNNAPFVEYELLEPFYEKIASVYRYKHGETQLELLFDGESHYEKYKKEWLDSYKKWVHELFSNWLTLRAILEITVYHRHAPRELALVNLRLQNYIEDYFQIRIYVYKGIVDTEAA